MQDQLYICWSVLKNIHQNLHLYLPLQNKVYGDLINTSKLNEKKTRLEIDKKNIFFKKGVNEKFSIDKSVHSFFGSSKTSADLYVQEYGKNFNLNTGIFRCGCITGENHAGTEAHGFLNYLTKQVVTKKKV